MNKIPIFLILEFGFKNLLSFIVSKLISFCFRLKISKTFNEATSQKVIILMTDEVAQTITGKNVSEVNLYATENVFEIFVFALPEHHNSFLGMVRGEQDRLYTPMANSQTVFQQIRQIFEDLCLGS